MATVLPAGSKRSLSGIENLFSQVEFYLKGSKAQNKSVAFL